MADGFGFGEGSLLEGLAPPAREPGIRTKRSKSSDQAHEAWKVWAKETSRPDANDADRKFLHAYREQLSLGRDHGYLLDVVRGAARLPVKANNADDTRRVINALKTIATGRVAVGALRGEQPVVPYPHGDLAPLKSSVTDVARSCRVPPAMWTERDQEAAGLLVAAFTAEQIEEAAIDASRAGGTEAVLPLEVLRAAKSSQRPTRRAGRSSATKARDTYAAGVASRDNLKGVELSLDDMAKSMFLKGAPEKDIVALHNQAPAGYWDAVFTLLTEGHSNESAYRQLTATFQGWHPSQRT